MSSDHPESASSATPPGAPSGSGDRPTIPEGSGGTEPSGKPLPPVPADHEVGPRKHVQSEATLKPARMWVLALGAGIVAGLVAWKGGESFVDRFEPETHMVSAAGSMMRQPIPASVIATDVKNSAIAFSIFGGVLGLCLGLAGGLSRAKVGAAIVAGIIGLALGACAGLGMSYAMVPIFHREIDLMMKSLTAPMLYHGAIWGTIGAACGLAFGIGAGGLGRALRCLVGGLLGGILGAVVFDMVGAVVFALDRTFQPISTSEYSRLLARVAVSLCIAVGAVLAAQVVRSKSRT